MDGKGFQVWLSAARGLTRAQRREALAVLSGRSEGEASKAAIELGVDEARRCPHCSSEGAVSRGMARGLRRYQCKGCGRTFNALSGTPLSGLHHKERWLSFGASLAKGETVKASAARCDVAVSTAFRWRHRFLARRGAIRRCSRGSWKRTRPTSWRAGRARAGWGARHGGGAARRRSAASRASRYRFSWRRTGAERRSARCCPGSMRRRSRLPSTRWSRRALLVSDGGASYPPCAAALGVSHEALNRSMGERVRGDLHVRGEQPPQPVEGLPAERRGIATRYLVPSWFHLVGLAPGANDRACLAAAVTR